MKTFLLILATSFALSIATAPVQAKGKGHKTHTGHAFPSKAPKN